MRRLPHVALILGIAVFMAADDVKQAENNSRRTDSTLGTVLDAAHWVSVADGFVLHVYSNEEFTRLSLRQAAYAKRRQEFLAKRKLLDEKSKAIERHISIRNFRVVVKFDMSRYDANKDGELDGDEQKRQQGANLGAFDANKDGKLTRLELMRYTFARRSRRTVRDPSADPKDVPENVDELLRELDSLIAKTESLTEQYKDVQLGWIKGTFYKVYKVIEVGQDFLRVRHKKEERIIPFASIREIRRTLDE